MAHSSLLSGVSSNLEISDPVLSVPIPPVDMVESAALGASLSLSSDDSDDEGSPSSAIRSPLMESQIQDIFIAANQLSKQDRIDAAAGRKRIQVLMNFLSAHGHSAKEVDTFAINGSISRKGPAHNLFDKNPLRNASSSKANFAPDYNTDGGEVLH